MSFSVEIGVLSPAIATTSVVNMARAATGCVRVEVPARINADSNSRQRSIGRLTASTVVPMPIVVSDPMAPLILYVPRKTVVTNSKAVASSYVPMMPICVAIDRVLRTEIIQTRNSSRRVFPAPSLAMGTPSAKMKVTKPNRNVPMLGPSAR